MQRPRVGGVLIDPTFTKVVLIRFNSSTRFMFPQGKLNNLELPSAGAKRKITEFTGYHSGEDFQLDNTIEFIVGKVSYCYFYVHNVTENTKFDPMYKDDVAEVIFYDIDKLSIEDANGRGFLCHNLKHCLSDVKIYCIEEKRKRGFPIISGHASFATNSPSYM